MAYNTILIKRRTSGDAGAPAALSGGELAFNEVDSTLYYGSNAGVIAIAGSGAFVNRTSDQTISGNKTFLGSTTLSSTTFSVDSTLDFGGNVLTNIGAPTSDTDAATKLYVDTVASNASTGTESLSTEVYNTFVKLIDDRAVNLTGGLTVDTADVTGNATVGGNLTVTGDLQVLGAVTSLETTTTVTSAFSITNEGSQTAFTVTQTGAQNVAEFYDDGDIALAVVDGGNVGIGTATPNEKLTVTGNISATGVLYAAGGVEISAGGGSTSLYVENGKVGINTEAPNEELTVVGTISATEDIFASNADFTGTLDVDGAATLGSTLTVTGASTLNSTLDVIGAATFASTVSAQGAVEIDSTLTVDGSTNLNGATTVANTLDVTGASTFASTVSAQGAVEFDSTLTVDGGVTLNDNLSVAGTSTLTGDVSAGSNVIGVAGSSMLIDFIIDGGSF